MNHTLLKYALPFLMLALCCCGSDPTEDPKSPPVVPPPPPATPYTFTPIYVDAKQSGKTGDAYVSYKTRILENMNGLDLPRQPPAFGKWGRKAGEKVGATGFFRVEKINGRWWYIDPEGYPTYIRGICELQSPKTPNKSVAYAQFFGSNQSLWVAAVADSLRRFGFNNFGLGGARTFIGPYNAANADKPISYTVNLSLQADYLSAMGLQKKEVSRVFDPEFVTYCDNAINTAANSTVSGVRLKDDPNLLGYYADNELVFGLASLERYLNLADPTDPGRVAAEAWMTENGYLKTSLDDGKKARFAAYEAEYYYKIVTAALRKYDTKHLFLSSRLHNPSKTVAEILQVENRYADVVSINHYGYWNPSELFPLWAANVTDKPVHITEFYSKAMDGRITYRYPGAAVFKNNSGVGVIVKTQRDRGYYFENYTLQMLENKQIIGFDLYKYSDDDPEGTFTTEVPDASNKGLFNNDLIAYGPLSLSATRINRNVYFLIDYFDKRP